MPLVKIDSLCVDVNRYGALHFLPLQWALCANNPAEKLSGSFSLRLLCFVEHKICNAGVSIFIVSNSKAYAYVILLNVCLIHY
jgi:hypothetical protein